MGNQPKKKKKKKKVVASRAAADDAQWGFAAESHVEGVKKGKDSEEESEEEI